MLRGITHNRTAMKPTTNIINRLFLSVMSIIAIMLTAACASQKAASLKAPEVKTALVSHDTPYEEKLQIPFDDKGVDIDVSLLFDETDNMLTLNLKGSRQLMVFRSDVYSGDIFRHSFLGKRRLVPSKLPYPVLVQPNMKITLSDDVWKSFSKKRSRHLINSWLAGTSPELTPITPTIATNESPEAPLVVESVSQRFRVDPNATEASFTLRNIFVIDKDGTVVPPIEIKRNPSAKLRYEITCEKDLNLTFKVRIQRDPCFGQDSLIARTKARVNDVKTAYTNLRKACPDGTVSSAQEQGVFNQHRSFLLSQFPCITDSSACAAVQEAYTQYNAYVDSIKSCPCVYVKPLTGAGTGPDAMPLIGVRASYILDMAHRLDNIVAQMMVSRDATQIHDLINSGNTIVQSLSKAVRDKGLINIEQRAAYQEFLKARSYFRSALLRQ